MVPYLKNEKGLTLIEIMAAVALLGIALIPLISAMNNEVRWNSKAGDHYTAVQLANEKIEEIQEKLRHAQGTSSSNQVPTYTNLYDEPLPGFKRTINSTNIDTFATNNVHGVHTWDDNLEKYTVTVEWNNGSDKVEVTLLGTEASYGN